MHTFLLSRRNGRFELNAHVNIVGKDILLVLLGGTAHIGAVAMAESRPSLADLRKTAATSSVYTYVGHKEDAIAKIMAEKLAKGLNRNVVVVAGIHWDNLREEEIALIVNMCPEITQDVMDKLLQIFSKTKTNSLWQV